MLIKISDDLKNTKVINYREKMALDLTDETSNELFEQVRKISKNIHLVMKKF